MAVRLYIQRTPETILDYDECGLDNYLAGVELSLRGHLRAGVYLMGAGAEVLLKSAYFRYAGAVASQAITKADMDIVALDARRKYSVNTPPESFHSIRFWTHLLIQRRIVDERPLAADCCRELEAVADRLHQNWHVSMRYRSIEIAVLDQSTVAEDVAWLIERHTQLWR